MKYILLLLLPLYLMSFDKMAFLNNSDSNLSKNKSDINLILESIYSNSDHKVGIDKLKNLANNGNQRASFYLGSLLENINKTESIYFYKKALSMGNYLSAYNLGLLYMKDNQNKAAIHYLTIAKNNNTKEAILPLAVLTKNEDLYKTATKLDIKNSNTLYSEYLLKNDNNDYAKYADIAYKKKESFVLWAKSLMDNNKTKEAISVLNEGSMLVDKKSKIVLGSLFYKKFPEKSISLLKNIDSSESRAILAKAYFYNNQPKLSLGLINGLKNKDNELIEIKDKICSKTNYCLEYLND